MKMISELFTKQKNQFKFVSLITEQSLPPSRVLLGSFTNYADKFLAFLITYPTSVAIFYPINFGKKSTLLDYPSPPLVNVVCERPLCLMIVVVCKSNHLKWKSILLCSKQLYCLKISWKFIGIMRGGFSSKF